MSWVILVGESGRMEEMRSEASSRISAMWGGVSSGAFERRVLEYSRRRTDESSAENIVSAKFRKFVIVDGDVENAHNSGKKISRSGDNGRGEDWGEMEKRLNGERDRG
jgi:hypothetical protein